MDIQSFRDLLIWQKGIMLVSDVYSISRLFPNEERYGLTSQIRRSAVSIPSNIAEGYGRNTTQDYIRFLRMSLGSLYEMQTQLEIAKIQGYFGDDAEHKIIIIAKDLEKMLISIIRKVEQSKKST